MAVYVDNAYLPFRGWRMCHLWADTEAELDAFAATIGIHTRWKQKSGKPDVHYDISPKWRREALAHGAREITPRELVQRIIAARKATN